MVDQIIEIPLPGRTLPTCDNGTVSAAAEIRLPAFVAGPENRLVAATFRRLLSDTIGAPESERVDATRSARPPVLALFGSPGTGKTHLSRGLVQHWQGCRGMDTADYHCAGDFRRDFAAAMTGNALVGFRRRIRSLELLAIDDLHQLPNDAYLLQELRYTVDALADSGALVVITSQRPVTTLPNLTADLRGRLAAGLMLQLAVPGGAARTRIVQHVTAAIRRPLSDDAMHRLVSGMHGAANQLIGALFEFFATAPVDPLVDVPSSERVATLQSMRQPTLPEIVAVVAKYHGLSQKRLKSSSRKQSVVIARATAVYLARELTDTSYDQIGHALGGRDHSTIMHNYKTIERDRQTDLATQQAIDDLRRILLCR